jgi:hypothetical protein
MLKLPPTLPVRTRIPLPAWALAGAVALFSLASSLLHAGAPSHHAMQDADQGKQPSAICQKVKAWVARG